MSVYLAFFLKPLFLESCDYIGISLTFRMPPAISDLQRQNPQNSKEEKSNPRNASSDSFEYLMMWNSMPSIQVPGLWFQGTTENCLFLSGPLCIRFLWKPEGSGSNSWYQEAIIYLISVTGPNASPHIVLTVPWALNLLDCVALGSISDTCLRCLPTRFPPH